ncbi:pyridoxamine 5'-phosphate oxidase family protein [Streptomyces sp. NPDC102415]|uniref:pyridoxamine 5'-phosphate oxidase family protein n=1 Tax=Streptomyces sp. NPDC102415 TaxID=3366173 RepID=UPI0038060137
MTLLNDAERHFLNEHRIGRLATTGPAARPHVVPVGFRLNPDGQNISIGGHTLEGRGQERLYLRHLATNPRAALVVDDVQTTPTWAPRGVLVKGAVTIHEQGGETLGPGFGPRWIEISLDWVSSWGVDTHSFQPASPRRA